MKKSLATVTSVLLLALLSVAVACNPSGAVAQGVPKAPSGKNCTENIAYLQGGVDRYKQAFGVFPADLNALLETKGDKGPFVQRVPTCPGGNRYVVDNGKVKEVSAR